MQYVVEETKNMTLSWKNEDREQRVDMCNTAGTMDRWMDGQMDRRMDAEPDSMCFLTLVQNIWKKRSLTLQCQGGQSWDYSWIHKAEKGTQTLFKASALEFCSWEKSFSACFIVAAGQSTLLSLRMLF